MASVSKNPGVTLSTFWGDLGVCFLELFGSHQIGRVAPGKKMLSLQCRNIIAQQAPAAASAAAATAAATSSHQQPAAPAAEAAGAAGVSAAAGGKSSFK